MMQVIFEDYYEPSHSKIIAYEESSQGGKHIYIFPATTKILRSEDSAGVTGFMSGIRFVKLKNVIRTIELRLFQRQHLVY